MQDKAEVGERVSDVELIALVSKAREEIEAHGEESEANLLLHDFARELLKKRLDDGAASIPVCLNTKDAGGQNAR
jgi:hypothetical protein